MTHVAAIVPAAGRAERFGSQKLLADWRGEPLVNHTLRSLIEGGAEHVVLVVAEGVLLAEASLVRDARVSRVTNPDPARGMFSSVQAGVIAAEAATLLVLPGDMPFVRPATVTRIVEAARGRDDVVVPVHAGTRGHPIALPAGIRRALLDADPRSSLKTALSDMRIGWRGVPVDDPGVLRDVDVRADLRGERASS